MVNFFFYKSMQNEELIQKISPMYEIVEGHASVHYYDEGHNILEIGGNNMRRNVLLHGKLVGFDISLNMVLQKINELGMDEFSGISFDNINRKYQVDVIQVVDKVQYNVHNAYIIY